MVQEADVVGVSTLRAVYRTSIAEIYGYVLLHAGGDRALAEDLTAETYLNAAERYRQGRGNEVTVPWLKTVAKRRLIDHWRRQSSLRRRADRLRGDLSVRSDAGGDAEAERHDVYRALATLSHDQRLALVLRHFDGLSVREVGEQLGRTEKAAESLLARAREAFRDAYGGEWHA